MSVRFAKYGNFVSARGKAAVLCCGVKVLPRQCLCDLQNRVTFVSAHTKPAVLNILALGLAEQLISWLICLAVPTHADSACLSGAFERLYY